MNYNRRNLKIIARFKNSLVHSYNNGELIISSKNKILKIKNINNPDPELIGMIPWKIFQNVSQVRIIDRILRNSILYVHKTKENVLLVITKQKWWHIDSDRNIYPIKKFSDTRPLSRGICESKNGITYVAEYINNPHRGPVRIFRTKDCKTFYTAWEFAPNTIRHVHAIIPDPKLVNRLWVLTGDLNKESKIYYTDNEFSTLNCFLSAGQKTRITDLIIKDTHLIWAPDSPRVAAILRVSKSSPGRIEELCKLPFSVYYAIQNDSGVLFFATVSPKNTKGDQYGQIFALHPDGCCYEIYSCKRTMLPEYGIIYFPIGVLPKNFIIFSQRALKPYEGYLTIAKYSISD